MPSTQYSWLIVTVLMLGSGFNYYCSKTERPYYNEILAIIYNITSAAYFYVIIVLCLCMLLKGTEFAGGVQLIALGTPLVSVIEFFSKHPKTYWLKKEVSTLASGEEWSKYLRYLAYVAGDREHENRVLLEAYVMKHMDKCTNSTCQITVYKNNCYAKDAAYAEKRHAVGLLALTSHVKRLYKEALRKFRSNPSLRINYAFFLAETMQDLVNAQKQLRKAQLYHPKFDEEFVIFRYCRILEEKMTVSKHQSTVGIDRVSLIAYENYFRQCKKKMKEAARLHIEFWSGFNTQAPDLAQLTKVSSDINKTITEIEEYWDLLEGINASMPKAILSYAKFLHDVLGDEESEKEILKNIKQDHKKAEGDGNKSVVSEFGEHFSRLCSSEGTPYLLISGEHEALGVIKDVNKASSRMFGYTSSELVGHNMDMLLPPLLRPKHNELLKTVTDSQENQGLLNRERVVPCQLASGYILLMTKSIRALPCFANDMCYVVTFKLDRAMQTKSVCYLLLDHKGYIKSLSESILRCSPRRSR